MRIAIVGSGVSGLAALWLLNENSTHEVEIFEKDDRLGGHAHTVWYEGKGEGCWVETAFILFNQTAWPNFFRFLRRLSIPLRVSEGSFSFARSDGASVWASWSFATLFGGRGWRYLFRSGPWAMAFDILWWNATALEVLRRPQDFEGMSTGQYLDQKGYSAAFKDDYLTPLIGAIFSLPPCRVMEDFPLLMLVRAMHNMCLLQLWGKPPWYCIEGGSREYIDAIVRHVSPERIHISTSISSLTCHGETVILLDEHGVKREFDQVILATHSEITLGFLREAGLNTPLVEEVLGAADWHDLQIVAHSDTRFLPSDPKMQASWNAFISERKKGQPDFVSSDGKSSGDEHFSVTFDVNRLQRLPGSLHGPILGTLNPPFHPQGNHSIIKYSQPIPSLRLMQAQRRLPELDEELIAKRIAAVGAWRGLGIHEDGWMAGLRAAMRLGGKLPFELVPLDREVPRERLGERAMSLALGTLGMFGWMMGLVRGVLGVTELGRLGKGRGLEAKRV